MKTVLAWLLLLFLAIQWIGGKPGYRVLLTIEAKRQMSAVEKMVAARLLAETGLDMQVEILQRSEINVDGIAYSNTLRFSKDIEGETVIFRINPSPADRLNYQIAHDLPLQPNEQSPIVLHMDQLFPYFTFPVSHLPTVHQDPVAAERHFGTIDLREQFQGTIPTPPPRWV